MLERAKHRRGRRPSSQVSGNISGNRATLVAAAVVIVVRGGRPFFNISKGLFQRVAMRYNWAGLKHQQRSYRFHRVIFDCLRFQKVAARHGLS